MQSNQSRHTDTARFDRRSLFRGGLGLAGALALSRPAQALFGSRPEGDDRTLVLVQLSGGNDGLSTLVPYGDDEYFKARRVCRVDPASLHKIDRYRGLHPALKRLSKRYKEGGLAIVQGIGYPGPNRSHFKSLDIWHSANLEGRVQDSGWIGRLLESRWKENSLPELSVHLGKSVPYSLHSKSHPPVCFEIPESYRWVGEARASKELETGGEDDRSSVLDRLRGVMRDARASSARIRRAALSYTPQVEYPSTDEGTAMRAAAALIDARLGSRVISVEFGGFDTHTGQPNRHARLMSGLDSALASFLDDLEGRSAGEKTLVLVFSEFGRRFQENGSGGTDHGKAGILFAAGAPVQGGLIGEYPSLTDLDDKDLAYNIDFRRAYASALDWLGADSLPILGEKFNPLPLFG